MIKLKIVELIHKEIDNEITDSEKSELKGFLSESPDALKLYRELNSSVGALKGIKDVIPPPDLKKTIMNSIDLNLYPKVNIKQKIKEKVRLKITSLFVRPRPKIAYAFAIGLIIGIFTTAFLKENRNNLQPADMSDFYGTIRMNEKSDAEKIIEFSIDLPQVTGTVEGHQINNVFWLIIDLKTSENFEYFCEYNTEEFRFISFMPLENKNIFQNTNNSVSVSGSKDSQFRLSFTEINDPTTPFDLKLFISGNPVYSKQFFIKRINR